MTRSTSSTIEDSGLLPISNDHTNIQVSKENDLNQLTTLCQGHYCELCSSESTDFLSTFVLPSTVVSSNGIISVHRNLADKIDVHEGLDFSTLLDIPKTENDDKGYKAEVNKIGRRGSWPSVFYDVDLKPGYQIDETLGLTTRERKHSDVHLETKPNRSPWSSLIKRIRTRNKKGSNTKIKSEPSINGTEILVRSPSNDRVPDVLKNDAPQTQYAQFKPLTKLLKNPKAKDVKYISNGTHSAVVRKGRHKEDVLAINYGLIRIKNCTTSQEYECIDKDSGSNYIVKVVDGKSPCVNLYEQLCETYHPSFVNVVQILEDSRLLYILLDNSSAMTSLHEFYISTPPKSITVSMLHDIFSRILKGLAFLHSRGYVLGSLSPESVQVLMDRKTGKTSAIISGIDSAVLLDSGYIDPFISEDRISAYYAPEVSEHKVFLSSDLWSCGVMLYQLVEGRLPYEDRYNGVWDNNCLSRSKNINLEFKSELWSASVEMADFCIRALQIDHHRRISSASEALIHPWIVNYTH
ncbi:protein kinase domain containing protein [Theileria equi strain WA]|uniref:Protein kinase domain containing protein n=1 Tax=Theileria equi strain WA TaxID=1537102 RepID=L1LGD0_THEEQ|nr:protein kinase domain containing protein [Theileria equi strain WA]EKX74324.1 protein kinase domain containing protein [Theileria equi strain WA]|eukprot:XP_004833776.1 protein kinase domain containing protein [Theileria equi strain WA]